MTSERRKSILLLSATLIVGILAGLLIPAFFHKMDARGHGRGGRDQKMEHKKDWFVGTVYRIAQPDSNQVKQIKPITEWASKEIEAIETSANERMSSVLDSVKSQLRPILTADQQKRMDDFDAKAKRHWRGRRGHR